MELIARFVPSTLPSTPPISLDGPCRPSESRATHHSDTLNALHVYRVSSCHKSSRVTINTLPDDVLLLIFYFDQANYDLSFPLLSGWYLPWRWYRLVHVCRSWRAVVFASPNFLDLKLVCDSRTRLELLGIWPPWPIVIRKVLNWPAPDDYDFDDALAHHNRVCEINFVRLTSSQFRQLASAMREQFPVLIHLTLDYFDDDDSGPVALPDGFLGGSAPRLQTLDLRSIGFPALPNLLLSATHLVRLSLCDIPYFWYISPEAVVTGLAVLINLESLTIQFEYSPSLPGPEIRRPSPLTRTVIPALTHFKFRGVSEYLEDLVARIDAPLLESFGITFFGRLIFDIPQLARFLKRTTKFQALDEAHVFFYYDDIRVESLPPPSPTRRTFDEKSGLRISCKEFNWELSSLAEVLASFFPSIYIVERLYIYGPGHMPSQLRDIVENMQWPEIFHPFTAVKNLYVCKQSSQYVALALSELIGERVIDVLPALQNIFLAALRPSGPSQESIGKFVTARQLLGHPVAVYRWYRH